MPIAGGVTSTETLHGALDLLFEVRLAAIQVIETPRRLPCQLDVRDLILAHGHIGRAIDENVRALQQRVAEKAVGREVAILELLLLVLEARYAFQPAQWGHHGQEQMQLRVLGNVRLDEQGRHARVQTGRQPVDQHILDVLLQTRGIVITRRQHVPVGHEEEALVLVLELDPVAQCPVVVAEVETAGRPHAREHAPGGCWSAQTSPRRRAAGNLKNENGFGINKLVCDTSLKDLRTSRVRP